MRKNVYAPVDGSLEWFRKAIRIRPLGSCNGNGLSTSFALLGAEVTTPSSCHEAPLSVDVSVLMIVLPFANVEMTPIREPSARRLARGYVPPCTGSMGTAGPLSVTAAVACRTSIGLAWMKAREARNTVRLDSQDSLGTRDSIFVML